MSSSSILAHPFPTAHDGIQDRMVYLQNFGASFIYPSLVNGGVLLIARFIIIG